MVLDSAYNVLAGIGADSLYRHVNPPLGVVFMCHSVGQPINRTFDPNGKWRISEDQLEMAISCADMMGFEAVTLDTVANKLNGKSGNKPFYALTFDDGYADNLNKALPVCEKYKVPMMVYVTSGFIQRKNVAWWHLIEELIANNQEIQLTINGCLSRFKCDNLTNKQGAFDQLSRLLTLATANELTVLIDEICNRYGEKPSSYAESLFMSETELKQFSANEYAHIGSHGVSHCAFSSLETNELQREHLDSIDYLTSVTGSKPYHLAYPFGTSSTVSERDFGITKNAGFTTAATTQHGNVYEGSPLHSLPRIPLFPTDTKNSLKCKLAGVTTLLTKWRNRLLHKR